MKHSQRIITAFFIILCIGVLTVLGNHFFILGINLLALLCLNEIGELKAIYKNPFTKYSSFLCLTALILSTTIPATESFWKSSICIILLILLFSYILIELVTKSIKYPTNKPYQAINALLLIGLSFPFAILIRSSSNGLIDVLFILATISTSDSGAYFTGKLIGKNQLTAISPKKTIEGTLGGFICSMATSITLIMLFNLPITSYICLAILLNICAPLGDLHESLTKRTYNAKDSSSLLPGHGGIYDRLDSYILNFPLFFFFKTLLITHL